MSITSKYGSEFGNDAFENLEYNFAVFFTVFPVLLHNPIRTVAHAVVNVF
jgi:hypothetical protein